MILPFNQVFKKSIMSGVKIHTIREDKPNRWQAGKKIHFATGVRTKQYDNFKTSECVSVQNIEISKSANCLFTELSVKVDGRLLSSDEVVQLALYDGFNEVRDFIDYFKEGIQGKLIHWTEKRY